jgi:hypothetical protein
MAQFRAFAFGYLTAYNNYADGRPDIEGRFDILRGTDEAGMAGFFDKYCRENPTRNFVNAVTAFVRDQQAHGSQSRP